MQEILRDYKMASIYPALCPSGLFLGRGKQSGSLQGVYHPFHVQMVLEQRSWLCVIDSSYSCKAAGHTQLAWWSLSSNLGQTWLYEPSNFTTLNCQLPRPQLKTLFLLQLKFAKTAKTQRSDYFFTVLGQLELPCFVICKMSQYWHKIHVYIFISKSNVYFHLLSIWQNCL